MVTILQSGGMPVWGKNRLCAAGVTGIVAMESVPLGGKGQGHTGLIEAIHDAA